MTLRFIITISIIAFCWTNSLASCGLFQDKKAGQTIEDKDTTIIKFDTSKTAIIPFNPKSNYPFDKSYRAAILTQKDISDIDSLLIICVNTYNNSLDKDHKNWGIDLKSSNYRKQLIAVTNKNGEKEVWVNCFCYTFGGNDWKTSAILVEDGGNCYFSFKINLTIKTIFDLSVNGVA